ncbi:MAG: hypothetical protein LBL31_08015 [Spirochaetaceae bacterium]|jgi:hypothetical protein|nr:hypothetical protein [Spirochaetaceae bacterium]
MTLEQAVTEILTNFMAGDYFDSHTVIDALLAKPKYHLAYLQGYSPNSSVAQYHGNIAKIIGAKNVARQIGNAKTHTIYGDLSDNMLWQKT